MGESLSHTEITSSSGVLEERLNEQLTESDTCLYVADL